MSTVTFSINIKVPSRNINSIIAEILLLEFYHIKTIHIATMSNSTTTSMQHIMAAYIIKELEVGCVGCNPTHTSIPSKCHSLSVSLLKFLLLTASMLDRGVWSFFCFF